MVVVVVVKDDSILTEVKDLVPGPDHALDLEIDHLDVLDQEEIDLGQEV